MRAELKKRDGLRTTFTGTFERYGEKYVFRGLPLKTVLLVNIKDAGGDMVCDHVWFTMGKQLAGLKLRRGDAVQFDARVCEYEKGYRGLRDGVYAPRTLDYKLSHPTRVQKAEI